MSALVEPKESSIFSGDYSSVTKREGLAVGLAGRIASDPHTITSEFWTELKSEFSDDELVELSFAASIFNWGNKFNITMQLDSDGVCYPTNLQYREVKA